MINRSMSDDFWEFKAQDSGKIQVLLAINKKLIAEDVTFWRSFIIQHLDHYIELLDNSNSTNKSNLTKGEK